MKKLLILAILFCSSAFGAFSDYTYDGQRAQEKQEELIKEQERAADKQAAEMEEIQNQLAQIQQQERQAESDRQVAEIMHSR